MARANDVSADPADVILRDGGTLRLAPPARADADALVEFYASLSERSRRMRFHGLRTVDRSLVEPTLDPDWNLRGALAGWLAEGDAPARIVAVASYARAAGSSTAEVAFSVADAQRDRGIATRMLEQLAARAREQGITHFVAEVMALNTEALSVFAHTGFDISDCRADDEIEIRFPLEPGEAFAARAEERDHRGVVASLRPFFEPRTVAVIGASRRRGSIGGELFRNILRADFSGTAYPVNRSGAAVAGVHSYTTIEQIPDPVDLAVICLPAEQVIEAAAGALRHGVRALCVISAGFAETGAEGSERQERLLALARLYGARLVGPNCLGIAVPSRGLNATFAPRSLPAGAIGFSSQSGALGLALLEKAAERNLRFSAFVSIGNKADVSSNDLLEWWEDDEHTALVLLYLESFGNPHTFARVARQVARRKPILALKAGTTAAGSRAASSHTAALAGSDAAVDALFRQAGVLRARTLEELLDLATLLSSQPLPAGPRVGVVTNAGGLGILCTDACESAGLELAALTPESRRGLEQLVPPEASLANPIDLLGSATAETYAAVLPVLLADSNLDALIVIFVPPVVAGADEVAAAIADAVTTAQSAKPVIAVVVSAEGTPAVLTTPGSAVAALPYPESAARALAHALARARWLERGSDRASVPEGIDRAGAEAVVSQALQRGPDVWLDASETRAVLKAYGLPLVPERVATTASEAAMLATELGLPAVVKSASPGVHKTELGAVALNLSSADEVRAAAARIGCPVIVQPLVAPGAEFLAGVVQDPVFGPLVAFGPGGELAELIGEASFRLAPLDRLDARELVTEGKAGRLVSGFRGRPQADADALIDLLHRLGHLAVQLPQIAELDLNPVIATADRTVAVDARIRVRATGDEHHSLKTW